MTSSVVALTSELQAVAEVDVEALPDVALHDELIALVRLAHRLDAAIAARAAAWDTRGAWAGDGSRSAATRLARETSVSIRSAATLLHRSRELQEMPVVAERLGRGEVSVEQVDVLARARCRQRAVLFERDEAQLADNAVELRHEQFVKVVDYWTARSDAELGDDGDPPDARTAVASIRNGISGEVHIEADLDPLGGAEVAEAMRRIAKELRDADRDTGRPARTRRQLHGAALVELARRAMSTAPGARPARPLVSVVCGIDTFAQLCELATGVVIRPTDLIAHVDAIDIETLLFASPTTAINRSSRRTFSGALRRAIEARDRHCQHPSGCDQPISRCDIDHIIPFAHGGQTEQANGRLLCTYHNRIHAQLATPPPRAG